MLEYKDENIVKSQDFWDLVENGFFDLDEENRLQENKDSKSFVLHSTSGA